MGINIIKPDHLGDLVLSSPAIKVLAKKYSGSTLWCASSSYSLAKYLVGELIDIRTVDFPHLSKDGISKKDSLVNLSFALGHSDLNVFLRRDPAIVSFASSSKSRCVFIPADGRVHQTMLDKNALLPLVGNYSRSKYFFLKYRSFPKNFLIKKIGIVPRAGFLTNAWPESYWARLCSMLLFEGLEVYLIGANDAFGQLKLISDAVGSRRVSIISCDSSFSWLKEVGELDLVVAVDGGTAHICSLVSPVISLFGPSPWRRFAPFGAQNVVLTRDVYCAPCPQFTQDSVNCCLYRHCLLEIFPDDIFRILDFFCFGTGLPPSWSNDIVSIVGASHINPSEKMAFNKIGSSGKFVGPIGDRKIAK